MTSQLRWRTCTTLLAVALSIALISCADDDGGGGGNQLCRGLCDVADCSCVEVVGDKTLIPSAAQPGDTPGSPGVEVDPTSELFTQFGTTEIDLNNATYTRYHIDAQRLAPDAVLILVPGFEGGASDFELLAEQLLPRLLRESDLVVELWAYDRRGDQLEDRSGLILAEQMSDAQLALDWLFGEELGLSLDPRLPRRAVIYNSRDDIPFLANWTPLVFARDIDAVVEGALAETDNVFLGGHSAGTGFTARYAATDFDLDGSGTPQPGYSKLRGLVLLEGGGGSTAGNAPSEETLDRIEARFDGGLFGAVRDGEARCVDGATPCAMATEDIDCAAFANTKCTESTLSYAEVPGLLNTRILASIEPSAIQGRTDPDSGLIILWADQNGVSGNNAISQVPALGGLAALGQGTVMGGVGAFVDDDGAVAGMAPFVAMSVGFRAPRMPDTLMMWTDITENLPPQAFSDNGPPPTSLPANSRWGVERESVRFDKLLELFIGETNFLDWYYPSSGLSVTNGLPSLDSSALSLDPPLGRGRRDIENLTQAASIDIPVIGFGGSNGLATVPAAFVPFANSIGICTAASCDGATPRVVDAQQPNPAFPTFGGSEGGFEVYISEGYAHVDVVVAEDVEGNQVIGPLAAFLARNTDR